MRNLRSGRGFERAGRLSADRLGLPRPRARELLLAAAWRSVAGDALARRVHPTGISRGVLELLVDDERWAEPLRGSIPRLAARLAALHPELGVRRMRIRVGEGDRSDAVRVDPEAAVAAQEPRQTPGDRPGAPVVVAEGDDPERLERAMEGYLDRAARLRPRPGSHPRSTDENR